MNQIMKLNAPGIHLLIFLNVYHNFSDLPIVPGSRSGVFSVVL